MFVPLFSSSFYLYKYIIPTKTIYYKRMYYNCFKNIKRMYPLPLYVYD